MDNSTPILQRVKRYAHLSDGHVSSVIESMNAKIFGGCLMTTDNYISFFEAKKILSANLGKAPSNEEFWLWCFFGRNSGYGIGAYVFEELHKKMPDKERLQLFLKWHKVDVAGWTEFGSSLSHRARMAEHWFFLRADIKGFKSKTRYITGYELLTHI